MAAASFPLKEFDEKFLTCPVCEEIYDDPRVLPCLHTFCAKCLDKWRKGESQFTCPTCRHQVRLQGDATSLSPNFYVNNLLDFRVLQNSEQNHTKCQMCQSDTAVEGKCADCDFLLCKICIAAHSNAPALKDHCIISLHDLKNPSTRTKYARAPFCPRHKDQRMTFYCQPCVKLVCRDCTVTGHRPGPKHDPQEVSEVAEKYKAALRTLVGKTMDTAVDVKRTRETVGEELTSITTNCRILRKQIQEHFAELRAKLDKEEQKATEKLNRMEEDQKDPLVKEEKDLKETEKFTEDGLKFCNDILARGNDVEILTLSQELEGRLNLLSSKQIQHEALKHSISFQADTMCTDLANCYLFLATDEPLFITEPPVESLPTSVIFRPQSDQVWKTNPQVTVTSPGGQCSKLDTTRTSFGAFKAVWRPQTAGKHVGGVATGERERTTDEGGILRSPLTVDVGSNNPVLRFGEKGSQQGQFDTPIDVAVRGDRLYVADTFNNRVQVFDLNGNFCYSFVTTQNVVSLAFNRDGTIVVKSWGDVMKFSLSGELLHKFPLGEHCTNPYGLAVQRDGRVVVADKGKHSISLFEADGTLVKQVGGQGQGEGEGQFNEPCFVCVDKDDNIIVSDKSDCRVQVFDKNLKFKHKFGQYGEQPQDMWGPMGVSADSCGNIVLANIGGDTDGVGHSENLQVFGPDGTWVSTISSDGDKLNYPHGVAVTEDGHVFVADVGDHCIRKYRYL